MTEIASNTTSKSNSNHSPKSLESLHFMTFDSEREFQVLNLDLVEHFIVQGRLTPKPDGFITMRDLLACGIVTQVRDGVKLLAKVCF
jgi:hypothetical protein